MDKIANIIREDAAGIAQRVDLSPLADKYVLLTGASGLIGTYVAAVLDAFGKCRVVIRMSKNEPPPDHPVNQFCNTWGYWAVDIANPHPSQLGSLFVDHVFCAAGYGQPTKFVNKPLNTVALNTAGLLNCLAQMRRGGRALFISSSEIYSGNHRPPFHEGDSGMTTPQHPRGCYIEAKRCGEAICAAYNAENPRSKAVAARVALAYGPGTRKDDDRVINQFIKQAVVDRKIALLDSGQALRTYCYIADTVEMLLKVWLHGRFDVYNVGGKSKTTIANLARKIGELSGNIEVAIPPSNAAHGMAAAPANVNLDTRLIESEFPKSTWVDLDAGLKRTIEWQKILYGMV